MSWSTCILGISWIKRRFKELWVGNVMKLSSLFSGMALLVTFWAVGMSSRAIHNWVYWCIDFTNAKERPSMFRTLSKCLCFSMFFMKSNSLFSSMKLLVTFWGVCYYWVYWCTDFTTAKERPYMSMSLFFYVLFNAYKLL